MRKIDKCADEHQRFVCVYKTFSEARCKWVCIQAK